MARLLNLARTEDEWTEKNLVLGEGQVGRVLNNTMKKKIGDGHTAWNNLPWVSFLPSTKSVALGNLGATETLPDPETGVKLVTGTLDQACTITMPEADFGEELTLVLTQGTGGTKLVTWDALVKWPANTAPTLSTAAGKKDLLRFVFDGTNWLGTAPGLTFPAGP